MNEIHTIRGMSGGIAVEAGRLQQTLNSLNQFEQQINQAQATVQLFLNRVVGENVKSSGKSLPPTSDGAERMPTFIAIDRQTSQLYSLLETLQVTVNQLDQI